MFYMDGAFVEYGVPVVISMFVIEKVFAFVLKMRNGKSKECVVKEAHLEEYQAHTREAFTMLQQSTKQHFDQTAEQAKDMLKQLGHNRQCVDRLVEARSRLEEVMRQQINVAQKQTDAIMELTYQIKLSRTGHVEP